MAVFRIEKTRDYTVMSNHHLRNTELSLKAKGLLSMMLSLPEDLMRFRAVLRSMLRFFRIGISSIRQRSSPKCTSSIQCIVSTVHSIRA